MGKTLVFHLLIFMTGYRVKVHLRPIKECDDGAHVSVISLDAVRGLENTRLIIIHLRKHSSTLPYELRPPYRPAHPHSEHIAIEKRTVKKRHVASEPHHLILHLLRPVEMEIHTH